MPGRRDYYEVLDVPHDADARTIKNAFRQLARRYHPDASTEPGEDIEIGVSIPLRQVLEGEKHAVTISRPAPCGNCGGSGAAPGTYPRACAECGGTGQRTAATQRGAVTVRQVTTCPACRGAGSFIDQPCRDCDGTGRTVRQERVTIRIPPGIPDETVMRLAGRGMPNPVAGAPPGDAYVIITTKPDARLTRQGADLWHELHISVPDAVLGTTADIPGLDRRLRLAVPAGTQPRTVLRITGKGLPRYQGQGRGDLNVTIVVDVPQHLSPRERRLYEQLRLRGGEVAQSDADRSRPDGQPRSALRVTPAGRALSHLRRGSRRARAARRG